MVNGVIRVFKRGLEVFSDHSQCVYKLRQVFSKLISRCDKVLSGCTTCYNVFRGVLRVL